jgi:hypothetical protein
LPLVPEKIQKVRFVASGGGPNQADAGVSPRVNFTTYSRMVLEPRFVTGVNATIDPPLDKCRGRDLATCQRLDNSPVRGRDAVRRPAIY